MVQKSVKGGRNDQESVEDSNKGLGSVQGGGGNGLEYIEGRRNVLGKCLGYRFRKC